jgi:hypothetical protein
MVGKFILMERSSMMKRAFIYITFLTCLITVCCAAIAQEIPSVPLNKPIDPKLINITGNWNYAASASTVTGMCPPGGPASGTCTISTSGDMYTLKILSGRICKPSSMCIFTGQLSGNTLVLSNTDIVDSEKGTVTNALGLLVVSNEFIDGRSSSRYIHPQGHECQWSNTMTLDRKLGK